MFGWEQSENERMLANLIRIGVVEELDEANARIKVRAGGLTTGWIPWVSARAGTTRSWSAPRRGEQIVLLSPYGDMAQAVALPSIYHADYPAPATTKDVEKVVYPDGTSIEYNSASHTFTMNVSSDAKVVINCKEATLNASTSVTLNTPTVHATGDILADGDVKAGSISLKNHTHPDPQGGNTSPPA